MYKPGGKLSVMPTWVKARLETLENFKNTAYAKTQSLFTAKSICLEDTLFKTDWHFIAFSSVNGLLNYLYDNI